MIEGADGAALPDRHFVTLAELRGGVAIELQGLRQRRAGVRFHRILPRGRGREFGDRPHAHRVMVAAAEERRAGRRAERGRVESRVLQTAGGELLEVRRPARAAERGRRAEAGIIDQDDQDVRCAGRRTDRPDRRILRVRVLRVERREADRGDIRNRQHAALDRVFRLGHGVCLSLLMRGVWRNARLLNIWAAHRTSSISPGRHVWSNHGSVGP